MERELVSIIIPVYNAEKYLEICIKSVMQQTYSFFECILINDGSRDNSENVIKNIIKDDERFKYIYQENAGPSKARNTGIKMARGKYMAFIDIDDRIDENYIKLLVEGITNSDLVCCGYIDESCYGFLKHTDFTDNIEEKNKKYFIKDIISGTGGVLWAKMFRTSIIKNNALRLDEKLYQSEDMIFMLEYVKHVKKWKILKKYIYHYNRLNDKSISKNISDNYLENYERFYKKLYNSLEQLEFKNDEIEKIINDKIADTLFYLFVNSGDRRKLYQRVLKNTMFMKALENTKKHEYINRIFLHNEFVRLNIVLYGYKLYLKLRGILGIVKREIKNKL